ncbi:MAG: LysE family transporter [Desulfovibrionaceae bacterium]
MPIDVLPFATFAVVTNFTPGPNNITCAALGLSYGYRGALRFIVGIAAGFLALMLTCAFLSGAVLALLPAAGAYVRWIGAAYILWLAWGVARTDVQLEGRSGPARPLLTGAALQFVNPKAWVYGLTIFSTFLLPLHDAPALLAGVAVVLGLLTFTATSTWAMCGSTIGHHMKSPGLRRAVNGVLALLLVYTAAGLLGWV